MIRRAPHTVSSNCYTHTHTSPITQIPFFYLKMKKFKFKEKLGLNSGLPKRLKLGLKPGSLASEFCL